MKATKQITGLASINSIPSIGLFNDDHMSYEIDRNATVEPSLTQMTQKALQILKENSPNGFFLLIEGNYRIMIS